MQDNFIQALADPTQPVPGGGATAAYAGTIALTLFEKIVRVEMRRHRNVNAKGQWHDLLEQALALGKSFRQLRDRDAASYLHLAQAKNAGKSQAEVTNALQRATDCPIRITEQACKALGCVSQAAEHVKSHLLADLQVVCDLLGAAGRGARHIAQANLILMVDPDLKNDYQDRLNRLHELITEELKQAKAAIRPSDAQS